MNNIEMNLIKNNHNLKMEFSKNSRYEPSGIIKIDKNGIYDVYKYANANVQVPEPTGTIEITENGTHNVYDYASADVNVMFIGDTFYNLIYGEVE